MSLRIYLDTSVYNRPFDDQTQPRIRQRADTLEQGGLKPLDALHVACAETAKAEYFVTCDDRLISRYQRLQQDTELIVCNPTELVRIVGE